MSKYLAVITFFMVALAALAQSDVDTRIKVNDKTDDKTFVVVIANEKYEFEEQVPFAENDGETFRLYCQKTLGIPEKHIHYVANATLNKMNYEIDWLGNVMKAHNGEARAIVYYSGHGMPDEDSKAAFLLPVDGYSSSPGSGISTSVLYQRLGAMPSRGTMVFLDACFSGAKRDGGMLQASRGVAIRPKADALQGPLVVFSAAQGSETAYPYKEKQHGMFTYYVLEKLQQTGGGVTMGELSDYVSTQVARQSIVENNKSQTPTVAAPSGNDDWKQWRLAASAAKRVETQPVKAKTTPATTPQTTPSTTPTTPQTTPATTPAKPTTPVRIEETEEMLSLVAQGKKAMRAMNYGLARKNFEMAATLGSMEALYNLGLLYSNSNFDGYNRDKATNYFKKPAANGHVDAQYQLGMMYLGVDNATAKQWLRRAAQKGHAKAQAQLSRLR